MLKVQSRPRSEDELILKWLQLADAGMGWAQIARRYGVKPNKVQMACTRAMKESEE